MYKARCKDNNMIIAIKILKLEDPSINLEDIRKEVLTMKLCNHENVLTCYCCFNVECSLWIVTPLMIKGSFLRILQYLSSHHRIQDGQGFQVYSSSILRKNVGGHCRVHHSRNGEGTEVSARLESPSQVMMS